MLALLALERKAVRLFRTQTPVRSHELPRGLDEGRSSFFRYFHRQSRLQIARATCGPVKCAEPAQNNNPLYFVVEDI